MSMKVLLAGYKDEDRLRYTAQKAIESSEFWREKFETANIEPGEMEINDLIKYLDTLKITPNDLYDPRTKSLVEDGVTIASTSGTSGMPKEIYVSEGDFKRVIRQIGWLDWYIKDGDVVLSLFPLLPSVSGIMFYRSFLYYSEKKKSLYYQLPPNLVAEQEILVSRINWIKPTIIGALPTVVYLLSNILPRNVRERVKLLITGGEELPDNLCRKILRSFPNAEIIDCYGNTEDGVTGFRKIAKGHISPFEFPQSLVLLREVDGIYRIYITKLIGENEDSGLYLFNYDIGDYAEVKDGEVYRIFRGDDMVSLGGAKLLLPQISEIVHRYSNLLDYIVVYYPLGTADKPKAVIRVGYVGKKPNLEDELKMEIYKVNNPVRYEVEDTKTSILEIEEVEVEDLRRGLPVKPGKPKRLYIKGKHF